jgi:hypothetical protein
LFFWSAAMTIHTVPSRDFARDVGRAKRLAAEGPVFITDRGRPAFALLKIEDYHQLTHTQPRSLLEVMDAIPGGDFEFEPPRIDGEHRPLDLE